jgi:tetratricopeptide (TPR) repeat protein
MRETNNDVTRKQEAHEWFNKGFAAEKMEDQISCYTKAINLYPEGTTTDLALAYNNRSAAYHNSGKYIEAIADCTKAINLYPEGTTTQLAKAYHIRAFAHYLLKNNPSQALADYNEEVKLGGGHQL